MTEFVMGAKVVCSDGFCGEVKRTILDPAARTVTHLVVGPRHSTSQERLVPLDLADEVDGEIRLSCTLAQFGQLEPAEDVSLAEGLDYEGGYGSSAAVQGYGDAGGMGVGGSSSGVGIGMGLGHQQPLIVEHSVPMGETEVERHEGVHAADGEIGRVEGFVVDPASHQVTHILLQEGHLWGHKEVAIPISAVESVDAGIRLNITKKQVEALPPLHQGHP
jgi:sporulation protein YlmC with PRC-barrel domain